MTGKIMKGIGGFYYVEAADVVYECKARGNFRKQHITPLAGDVVEIQVDEIKGNVITAILPRRNVLVRPAVANIDQLFIVVSSTDPEIRPLMIDRLIAVCEMKEITPIIVFTKVDLSDAYMPYVDIYKSAGFQTAAVNTQTGEGADVVRALLKDKVSAFAGNTGVGKSSLLNAISPQLRLKTGETSKKLGRGRHTTRQCELLKVCGGYVADTPGFSSVDTEKYTFIPKDKLADCFREFRPYLSACRFTSCRHLNDKGCAVVQAVEDGKISKSRYASYAAMYEEVRSVEEWQKK